MRVYADVYADTNLCAHIHVSLCICEREQMYEPVGANVCTCA